MEHRFAALVTLVFVAGGVAIFLAFLVRLLLPTVHAITSAL